MPASVTVDQALAILQRAKERIGGNACLILSLTRSGLPDTDIDTLTIIADGDCRYVQVECQHPYLTNSESRLEEGERWLENYPRRAAEDGSDFLEHDHGMDH